MDLDEWVSEYGVIIVTRSRTYHCESAEVLQHEPALLQGEFNRWGSCHVCEKRHHAHQLATDGALAAHIHLQQSVEQK